jgi:hypothetical protein
MVSYENPITNQHGPNLLEFKPSFVCVKFCQKAHKLKGLQIVSMELFF